jgi:hypothetical protein
MGYFDAVAAFSFKTAPDGRKVFFPWGAWGRGYTVASERDYRQLHRQIKVQWVSQVLLALLASLVFVDGPASLKGTVIVAILIVLVLYFACHVLWLRYWLPRLRPSNEKFERLPLQERMNLVARAFPAVVLWFVEIGSLAFVACAILIVILDPGQWRIALAGFFSFGFAAAFLAYMLVLRRRPVRTRS